MKTNIVLCPLLPEEDFLKSKSSITLYYFIKANLRKLQEAHSDFNIITVDSPSAVKVDDLKRDSVLCLIDDFIGTGETAENAARYFLNQFFPKDSLIILSLVSMKVAIENLYTKEYYVYAGSIQERAITGKQNSEKNASIMRKIEVKINVKSRYCFGYGQSEALVKMIRTPNNTFPIY